MYRNNGFQRGGYRGRGAFRGRRYGGYQVPPFNPNIPPPPVARRFDFIRRPFRRARNSIGSIRKAGTWDIFPDLQSALMTGINSAPFIFCALLSVTILVSHAGDLDNGPLAKFFPSDSTNYFVKWARANVKKFFGLICFAPAIFAIPLKYRFGSFLFMCLWIAVVPEAGIYEYVAQASIFIIFLRVQKPASRIFLVCLTFLLYFGGFFLSDKQVASKKH